MTDAAQALLLEYIDPQEGDQILILEGSSGWLAQEAARLVPDGAVLTLDRDVRNVEAAQTQLDGIPNAKATLDVIPKSNSWDIVLLTIPKERSFARKLLVAACQALKTGGKLLLAGPSKGGAKAVIKDAERLFGTTIVLGYRDHQRVALCKLETTIPDPLPKEFQQAGIAPRTHHCITIDHPKQSLKFETQPGIFSWESLDEGTALLLKNLEVKPNSRVWDVGCGYGVIGIWSAAAGAGLVAMSDVNLIATHIAQKNSVSNQVDGFVKIFPGDGLQSSQESVSRPTFDLIVSNPAFHQGRRVDKSMADQLIQKAGDHLVHGGRLVIVANHFLNYDRTMRDYFEDVKRIAETSKYHILEALNS
jgi:16S rRNA (guanine1207-N2)-methyltransferase